MRSPASNLLLTLLGSLLLLLTGCGGSPEGRLNEAIRKTSKLELAETEAEQTFVIRGKEWKDVKSIGEGLSHLSELLKPGERIGVYSFRSYAVAYIDLSAVRDEEIVYDDKDKRVKLILAAVQVESIGRSTTLNVLHERVSGSQEPITPEEKKALQDRASKLFLESLQPGAPLYEELAERAEKKAKAFFDGMARANGYTGAEVTFKDGKEAGL